MLLFQGYVAFMTIRFVRARKRALDLDPTPPEPGSQVRAYRSRTTLLGWPLLDVKVADPAPAVGTPPQSPGRGRARGWVAVDNRARGLVLALGIDSPVGLVALGSGRPARLPWAGPLPEGSCWAGSRWARSRSAVGVGALAVGGGAIARHAAAVGLAIPFYFASGGEGAAAQFNTPAARAALDRHPLKRGQDWALAHRPWVTGGIVALSVLPNLLIFPLMYRRRPAGSGSPVAETPPPPL